MINANIKQTGQVNHNEWIRKHLGEDKNRNQKVDITMFVEKQKHDKLMEQKQMWLDILKFTAFFLVGMVIMQAVIEINYFI